MKRYKAIIVEDIPNEAKFLSDSLKKICPETDVLSVCDTLERAVCSIEKLQPQLIFLDIELGSKNGFDLLKTMPAYNFQVIFVTSHAGYMLDALRVSVADYLLKPYSLDALREGVTRAIKKFEKENLAELSGKLDLLIHNLSDDSRQNKMLLLTNKDGQHRIPISDIIYCSTTRIYTDEEEKKTGIRIQFRLTDGSDIIVSNTSVSWYEEILTPFHFARVSQAFLVNMNHIKVYQKKGGKIIMQGYHGKDGKTVEEDVFISDPKKEWFDKVYNDFTVNPL